MYGTGERITRTKLLLESLEQSFQHHEQVPFDNLTIEHVMPQSLTSWWRTHLGTDHDLTHDLLLHTLGNLTLTGYNPQLSNADFDEKKRIYAESHVSLNEYFAGVPTWKHADIVARSHHLADVALTIWPYFGDGDRLASRRSYVNWSEVPCS